MYSRVETITPEIAKNYLLRNRRNRPLKHRAIRNYAKDMRNGKWQLSDQGISFYQNGTLADGQNRLEAIILAGVPVQIYVTYDVPNGSTIHDRGVIRTSGDILRMSGMESSAASNAGVGIANALFMLAGNNHVSENTRCEFIYENEACLVDAITLVRKGMSHKTTVCNRAFVGAAAFCALYSGVSYEVLDKFFSVANTGFQSSDQDSAVIVLRNYLLTNDINKNYESKRTGFTVATNSILDFTRGNPRKRKYRTDLDPAFFAYVKEVAIDKYLI